MKEQDEKQNMQNFDWPNSHFFIEKHLANRQPCMEQNDPKHNLQFLIPIMSNISTESTKTRPVQSTITNRNESKRTEQIHMKNCSAQI
jgi:chorismate synthase